VKISKILITTLIVSIILIGLYFSSLYDYLLFHLIVELFSVIVAGAIFVIAWNTRRFSDNSFFLFIGISFIFIAGLDFIHALAYKGMNIFHGYDANLATQLWIVARYTQSFSFLLSTLVIKKKLNKSLVFLGYSLISVFFGWLIFTGLFPACYEGGSLTPFKIDSEYIIILIFTGTILLFYQKRKEFDSYILKLIILALLITIAEELAFTLYSDVYGLLNLVGHFLKIFAFYCIYKALIETTLLKPYDLLFRNLKKSEENLVLERNTLITLNKQIETIIQTVPDGILLLDTEGRIYLTNNPFQEIYRETYHENFSLGKKLLDLPENILINSIKDYFISKKEKTKIVKLETDNYFQISSSFIHLSDEALFGSLIVIHDVTEFIEIENIRKQILTNVSHELRTPLTVINMSIKNLDTYGDRMSEDQKASVIKMISKNSVVLSQMIEDLLTSSSIEARTIQLQWVSYQFLELIQEILIELEPPRSEKNISVELEIDPNLQLFGDSRRISQIFRILIDNAIKYSHEKSTIKIEATDHYSGKFNSKQVDGVLVQVSDTGIGIRSQDIPHLFKRFFRSDDVKNIKGTGIGLPIAKELTQLHKGNIYVESDYGKGTTFSVFLPRIENQPEER